MEIIEGKIDGQKIETIDKGSVPENQIFINPAVKQKIELKVLIKKVINNLQVAKTPEQLGISPDTPLVQTNSANPIVGATSVVSGFDVTGPTPVAAEPIPSSVTPVESVQMPVQEPTVVPAEPSVSPLPPTPDVPLVDEPVINMTDAVPLQMGAEEDTTVENAINAQVNSVPKALSDDVALPSALNEDLTIPNTMNTKDFTKEEVPTSSVNPFVETNVEIEKLRNEVNNKIDKISNDLSIVRKGFNSSLDGISRRVEAQRQLLDESVKNVNAEVAANNNAVAEAIQNGVQSLEEVQTPTMNR